MVTFSSTGYMVGATLGSAFTTLALYGLVTLVRAGTWNWLTAGCLGLALAFGAATLVMSGRGWVRVRVEPQQERILVRRWFRPTIELPLRPGAIRVRPATSRETLVGPVLIRNEEASEGLREVLNAFEDPSGLQIFGKDDDPFLTFELHRSDAAPRRVLVPFDGGGAQERLAELARLLGPALVDVSPPADP